jgi:hypothetical protein
LLVGAAGVMAPPVFVAFAGWGLVVGSIRHEFDVVELLWVKGVAYYELRAVMVRRDVSDVLAFDV